jgi:hypothetical protein
LMVLCCDLAIALTAAASASAPIIERPAADDWFILMTLAANVSKHSDSLNYLPKELQVRPAADFHTQKDSIVMLRNQGACLVSVSVPTVDG